MTKQKKTARVAKATKRAPSVPKTPRASNLGQGGMKPVAAAYSFRERTSRPDVSLVGNRRRLSFCELVVPALAGSSSFTVQHTIPIQPGLASSFSWAAPIARQYQQYEVESMMVEYIPAIGSDSKGDVIISPEYDVTNAAPTSETEAQNAYGTVVDRPWMRNTCPLEAKDLNAGRRHYIRAFNVAGDQKTYDCGKIHICTVGQADTSTIGKIKIHYAFWLYIPQNTSITPTLPTQTSMYMDASGQSFTTTAAAAKTWDAATYDPLGFGASSSGVFTPAAGVYDIFASICGKDTSNEGFSVLVAFYKNGAVLDPDVQNQVYTTVPALGNLTVSLRGVVAFNGTDTFDVVVTMTGTAGTLTSVADKSQLIVRLA